ncbi:MAG: aminopeptidase P family protein [Oceanospirillaceae bacterium]|nr:aminopeptidase P family protein [Oceanospirillaceae bacterium]
MSKIDSRIRPSRSLKPDGSPSDNDRVEIGPTQLAFDEWEARALTAPNLTAMREYRLSRIVQQLEKEGLDGILLFDPLNIRYATDTTNMQVWITHNHARACFVSTAGYVVLWDFHNCEHLSAHLPLVREVRSGASFFYFETGSNTRQHAAQFAAEIESLLQTHAGEGRRLAIDKIEIEGLWAIESLGIQISDGQQVMEHARVIKSVDEVNAMRCSIAATESAMHKMREASVPGVSENDIWAVLHAENIRRGGEWIECRLLSSGPRTNPWFQESGPRIVQAGDMLAFDTDLIGPYGICADLSRSWVIGDVKPTDEQRRLYQIAYEHIQTNMSILKPGMTLNEITQKAHRLPPEFRAQRYGVIMHGIGLCDEYPCVRYPEDVEHHGYEGVLEPGMTLCVEAYVGAVGGREGVKLEDQVLITEDGFENLTQFPFEASLLNSNEQ